MVRVSSIGLVVLSAVLVSCKPAGSEHPPAASPAPATVHTQRFQVKGVVVAVQPGQKEITIKHEAVPDYMPAMTMPFEVRDTNELAGVKPGDAVVFRLLVTETEGWIDQLRSSHVSSTNGPPAGGPARVMRDVAPLAVGDQLPEYHFTNQLGRPITTRQFAGQALAVTFLFTRCPYPDFCPRMARQFSTAQAQLQALAGGPTNWQLLAISFDPDFDRPAVLKTYAESHQSDPAHWTFATGDLVEVTALGDQLGLEFSRDNTGSISHNLRTAVFDAGGHLQKLFAGNQWSGEELVAELVKAATAGR